MLLYLLKQDTTLVVVKKLAQLYTLPSKCGKISLQSIHVFALGKFHVTVRNLCTVGEKTLQISCVL